MASTNEKKPNPGGRPPAQNDAGEKPATTSVTLRPSAKKWLIKEYGSVTDALQSLLPEEFKTNKTALAGYKAASAFDSLGKAIKDIPEHLKPHQF